MTDEISKILRSLQDTFCISASPALKDAVAQFPRASFALKIYDDRNSRWLTANDNALWQSLIDEDRYLPIQVSVNGEITSSISQPSLVLAMIEKLDLRPGLRVLEIGTASGWSAALMSSIVGESGEVVTTEIDNELFMLARRNIDINKIRNVSVLNMDGSTDLKLGLFDRIIYTVGARDFSECLITQLSENGRVVVVHKFDATADVLYSGEKRSDRIYLEPFIPVLFVEMRGHLEGRDDPKRLSDIDSFEVARPFWGDVSGSGNLLYKTAGLRFFLRNYTKYYTTFVYNNMEGFGLYYNTNKSAFIMDGSHHIKGDRSSIEEFFNIIGEWAIMGLPGLTGFNLEISKKGSSTESAFGFNGSSLRYDYRLGADLY